MPATALAGGSGPSFCPMLLVPIISTTTLGSVSPSNSPFWRRHKTCCVRSPEMPKLAALSGPNVASKIFFCGLFRQPSVIESPAKSTSKPPFFASSTNASWRLTQPPVLGAAFSPGWSWRSRANARRVIVFMARMLPEGRTSCQLSRGGLYSRRQEEPTGHEYSDRDPHGAPGPGDRLCRRDEKSLREVHRQGRRRGPPRRLDHLRQSVRWL